MFEKKIIFVLKMFAEECWLVLELKKDNMMMRQWTTWENLKKFLMKNWKKNRKQVIKKI